MIEFKNVCASYDVEVPILKDVSFTINDGDFLAVVGTNGAGKSTTMRLVNGLLKPTAGEVLIDGVPTTQLKTSELARKVGFLFQNPDRQICCNTVREELMFGFKALGEEGSQAQARVDALIERFGFDPQAEPFLLNRGTRQLLALASIIALEPPVVVLDEPTTGLDFRECSKVMDIIAEMNARGTTVIMVCHDMEVVADYAKRVIAMTAGQVVADGPTFEVLRNRDVLARTHLLAPQIVDISLCLADECEPLRNTAVARANTLNEMTEAMTAAAQGEGSR
ncbi:MAG: ABC transporter ATP-binding protein [Eggerthellaceae bacterium]|nr:ABC transporter ATP-binding protein [Eggerthellaceae bacterium]